MSEPVWWCSNCRRPSGVVCSGCHRSHDVIDLVAVYYAAVRVRDLCPISPSSGSLNRWLRRVLNEALGGQQ